MEEGFLYDTWDVMDFCSTEEDKAKLRAKAIIRQRLLTEQSKSRTYQAYITKEDVVRFENEEEVIKD